MENIVDDVEEIVYEVAKYAVLVWCVITFANKLHEYERNYKINE